MGLFSFLGRKSHADDGPEAGSGPWWKQELAAVDNWRYGNEDARGLVVRFLTEVAEDYGPGQVKELPDNEHVDLRGTFEGAPIRFAIWMAFGSFWTIEMMLDGSHPSLFIERDHTKIPREATPDDPWSKNEVQRIFLAKGIFVEGSQSNIVRTLQEIARIPEDARERLFADMERLDMRNVGNRLGEADKVALAVKPKLGDLDDARFYMKECAAVLSYLRQALAAAAPAASAPEASTQASTSPPATFGQQTLRCAYCSSLFVLTPDKNTCPNCGAPAQ